MGRVVLRIFRIGMDGQLVVKTDDRYLTDDNSKGGR